MKMLSNSHTCTSLRQDAIYHDDQTHSRRYTFLSHIQNIKYFTIDAFRIVTLVEEV